jgi:hypothetical protein
MPINRPNIEKIKAIIYDYDRSDSVNRIEFTIDELEEIAKRIETEVMGIQDPNEFVNLTDLTKKK